MNLYWISANTMALGTDMLINQCKLNFGLTSTPNPGPVQGVGYANEPLSHLTGEPVLDHTQTSSTRLSRFL